MRRSHARKSILAGTVLMIVGLSTATVSASWTPPPGVDLTRPRLLLREGDVPVAQERLAREPYRGQLAALLQRIALADNVALADDTIVAHRFKARAAKDLAFLYAIDRTLADGEVAALSAIGQRQAVGDRARDLLLHLFARSRLAVDPPIGGWDRDISTSEELLQYAVAYDTLLGAGYDFGADHDAIVDRLVSLASELYENFLRPETAGTWANLHQNNHRSKTGAALVVAGLALAEYTPPPGTDPRGVRDPQMWIDYGLDLVDSVTRWVLVTGDGAYAEGPFYWRYTMQNLLPMARAWNRLLGGETYVTASGLRVRDFWTHPLFTRSLRWMLDMTLPDGSLAPVDDGNPGRSFYFGLVPPLPALAPAFAWRWQHAPQPFETEGNVDLAADAIVAFDDGVVPAPPSGSPTAFYVEGGSAILRSDWSEDAVVVVIQGEHDTASSFGRDRNGRGVGPQSHEHADPGSFLLHAFGERLVLDPGYLNFGNREAVNQPEHHNLILVDGKGPVDYLNPSFRWNRRTGRPPIDGNASLSEMIDTGFADAVRVTSRYGQPAERAAEIQRRFILLGDRTLVIADDVVGPANPPRRYSWLLHGNGGGEGGFAATAHGGVWTRGAARVSSDIVFDVGTPELAVSTAVHEEPGGRQSSHAVMSASVTGEVVRSLQLVHPSRSAQAAPMVREIGDAMTIGLELIDTDENRRVIVLRRRDGAAGVEHSGLATDGTLLLAETSLDGVPRSLWAEEATWLQVGEERVLESDGTPDILGLRLGAEEVEGVAAGAVANVTLRGLGFVPAAVDDACGLGFEGEGVVVRVTGERRFRLRALAGDARPGAAAGEDRRAEVGQVLGLDGGESCDADGGVLAYEWELVSAPAGSEWQLEPSTTARPQLQVDRAGPYRVRLKVRDAGGQTSEPSEVVVYGGAVCADDVDNDLDGLFDSEDPDCDRGLPCAGDCTGEGQVTIDELIRAVDIALGQRNLSDCSSLDRDGSQRITVDELIAAIDVALRGCSE